MKSIGKKNIKEKTVMEALAVRKEKSFVLAVEPLTDIAVAVAITCKHVERPAIKFTHVILRNMINFKATVT